MNIENQLRQVKDMLRKSDADIRNEVHTRAMLQCYEMTLERLIASERFCHAARALAHYKEPLAKVLNALDGWERIAKIGDPT